MKKLPRLLFLLALSLAMCVSADSGVDDQPSAREHPALDPQTGLSSDGFDARQERRILTLEAKIAEQRMEIMRLQRDILELKRDMRSIRR